MSDNPTPALTLAKNITVSRKPGGGEFDLSIDGEPFGYYLAGDAGAKIEVSTSKLSAVTITILAETVTVDDRLMDGQSMTHHHDEDDQS